MQLIDVALSGTGRRGQDQHRTDVQRAADHICEKHCRVERVEPLHPRLAYAGRAGLGVVRGPSQRYDCANAASTKRCTGRELKNTGCPRGTTRSRVCPSAPRGGRLAREDERGGRQPGIDEPASHRTRGVRDSGEIICPMGSASSGCAAARVGAIQPGVASEERDEIGDGYAENRAREPVFEAGDGDVT